ncbi:MAG: CDP-alcohol phosphatidyltransferase family protein [Candidatus Doudnabacteria bacterium]|nr:CDP-alcohol phosphatidyltransferase family protein [Candidatus Doudnabacteria bacterium]
MFYGLIVWLISVGRYGRKLASRIFVKNSLIEELVKNGRLTPNGLTAFRIFVSGGFLVFALSRWSSDGDLYSLREFYFAIFLAFLSGQISDGMDGAIARHYAQYFSNATRKVGTKLDRHADKILIATGFGMYSVFYPFHTKVLIAAMIAGDLFATILAISAERMGYTMHSNRLGKAKMVMQCVAIDWAILGFRDSILDYLLVSALTLGFASLVMNCALFVRKFSEVREIEENARESGLKKPEI